MTPGLAPRVYAGATLAAASVALALAVLSVPVLWLVPLTAAAIYFAYRGHVRRIEDERRNAEQMSRLHLATIEALALAIDAKDQTTPNHVQRVQAYATGLAREMGMSDMDVQAVTTAALLHDIGKLAIPDDILAKPGPLSPEELQKVRIHPEVGAEIIRTVPFPYPVAPLILSHHERFDGRGYPAGLKGDEIPLGARVVGIVDYFDALTSDRPYHKALSTEGAVAALKEDSGKALDPGIVDAFVEALPRLMAAIEPGGPKRTPWTQTGAELLARGMPAVETSRPSVFDDIAVAHREIYALYQIAQTMGTKLGLSEMMSLVSPKLSQLVPFSSCALFLYSESTEQLHCRFAIGPDSELVQQLAPRSGQGLNGWVARNRRPLVNARPSAEFEATGSTTSTMLQSALVCPLVFGEQLVGTLAVYHTEPGFYNEDHGRLLGRVCEQAAAVIHKTIVFEQTQEDSLTDPLTGLPNPRSMFQHLTREIGRAERLSAEMSLVLIDLDNFKDINDTYGHQMGDAALCEVATVLRGAVRPYDVCVRYGGDEFVVVLPGCTGEEAERKRLELQHAVDRIVLEARHGDRVALSISAGAAVYPYDGDTQEALLATADSRMYRDKIARKIGPARRAATA